MPTLGAHAGATVSVERLGAETGEVHDVHAPRILAELAHGLHGDLRGVAQWIPVDTGADGGKGDGAAAMLARELEGRAIGAGEELRFALCAAVPDRSDGVNYVFRGELEPWRDAGVASGAAILFATGEGELRAGGAVDGAAD